MNWTISRQAPTQTRVFIVFISRSRIWYEVYDRGANLFNHPIFKALEKSPAFKKNRRLRFPCQSLRWCLVQAYVKAEKIIRNEAVRVLVRNWEFADRKAERWPENPPERKSSSPKNVSKLWKCEPPPFGWALSSSSEKKLKLRKAPWKLLLKSNVGKWNPSWKPWPACWFRPSRPSSPNWS